MSEHTRLALLCIDHAALDLICEEVASGRVKAYSEFNDLPCNDVSMIRTAPWMWYCLSEGAHRILQKKPNGIIERQP